MKKLLILLALVLFVPSFAVTDAALEWQIAREILSTTAGFDTLVTSIDSSTILARTANFEPNIRANNGGWTYWLQCGRSGGASKDSSMTAIRVDAYTANGVLIGSAFSDTCIDRSETYMYKLPIGAGDGLGGDAFFGDTYVLKMKNTFSASTACSYYINGPIRIIKSRPLNYSTNVTR